MSLEKIVGEKMRKERKENNYEQIIYLSDLHIPYEDMKTVKVVNKFLKMQQPEQLILGGDILDMYSISRYDKDPKRAANLQNELDRAKNYLKLIRLILPDTKIIYLEGNHEDRLRKYLMRNPELESLKALTIKELLGLEKLDISFQLDYTYKGFLFKHGNRTNMYNSAAELKDEGSSGMSGHLHKPQVYMDKTRRGEKKWISVGHLSEEKDADYLPRGSTSNWIQGFGLVNFFKKEKLWEAHQIDIINNKFVYEGLVYK